MNKLLCLVLLVLIARVASGQPGTDIYLFNLSSKKSKVTASEPVNITSRKGYDNQPFFHPDQPLIYFSSADTSGRTNIMFYNFKTKAMGAVTDTPEREYSPTVTPDKEHLSCIIQRDNGAQDLGKYSITGGVADVIIDNLIVGYHVWADNSHLGLFVLGTPNSLHYLRLPTKKDTIVAQGIGRSLHKIPGESAISFVHKISESDWQIKKLSTSGLTVTTITSTMAGREDLCWTPDGKILMSDGTDLFFFIPGKSKTWTKVEVESPSGILKNVTRLAVNRSGDKLAVVVAEQ